MKTSEPKKVLKVGIIVDDADLHFIAWDLIERSRKTDAYDISTLIVQKSPSGQRKSTWTRLRRYLGRKLVAKLFSRVTFELITRVEAILVRRMHPISAAQKTKPLDAFDVPVLEVKPEISKSGLVYRFTPHDLAAIEGLNLDVLVRAGSGILRGEILSVCRFGVLSFHHGDNRWNRGSPAGFWEVYSRSPKTGFIIQRLTEELDGGAVLFRGAIRTKPLFLLNQSAVYFKSAPFFDSLLKRISAQDGLPKADESWPHGYPLFTTPTFEVQLKYVANVIGKLSSRLFRRLLKTGQRWAVAYMRVPHWRNAVLRRATKIPNPAHRYLADPFVWSRGGRDVIFVEDFETRIGKGVISAIDITESKPEFIGPVLTEPFHLSFPFLLEVSGDLYMIPETHEAREIRIYKCDAFPDKWSFSTVLISGVAAADTVVFFKNGFWWLLTNIDSAGMKDHESELHVFFSDQFPSSCWTPHPANPVVFDPEQARNGGLIINPDGEIFRVFQRQSIDYYGAGMGIALIKTLSPNEYKEEIITEIGPDFISKAISCHSLNFNNGILVLDFAKVEGMSQ